MKLTASLLILCVAAIIGPSDAALPENFVERVEAILRWFDLRISVYRKANILLKQLARKVNALPAYHDGMIFYYRKWLDYPVPQLKLLAPNGVYNGTERVLISDMLKQTLDQQDIKQVLSMMPEVREAFKKLV